MFEKGIPGGETSIKNWFIPESQHFCIWKLILWKYLSCLQRFRFKYISVQFSCLVLSDYLWPNGWQYARPPCPLPTPRIYSNSSPLSLWCHPIISTCHLLLLPPSIFPRISVSSNESVLCIRWPKYWSFSFNISPSKEYSGLISFRMDWLDLLAVQRTLKSLFQHHSSKASIPQCSACFFFFLILVYF